jgi:localization factor PodJL
MTLGEWLNQMILEDGAAPEPEPGQRLTASVSPQALSTAYAASRRGAWQDPTPPDRADDVGRVLEMLERLSARVEAAEHRSTLAITGIDKSVIGVLRRLETAEREQVQVAARFEGALDETRAEQARIDERLRRMEQGGGAGHRSVEAMRALEAALNKVAAHLYEGESRTREAMEVLRRDLDQVVQRAAAGDAASQTMVDAVVARIAGRLERAEAGASDAISNLQSSFASLESRLRDTEAQRDLGPVQQKFEQLAEDLTRQVEQVRQDVAERVATGADARIDRLDQGLREVAAKVEQTEKRSAQTIEKIGRDVLQIAASFSQKMQESEERNIDAIGQLGADVQRMATVVEQKLQGADVNQAEALEKLGVEIARITERLSERIANAERRSAQAIDDVGEQMARVSERANQRQERASSELLDRMRQSEERTARLLEEARERIDRRLGEVAKTAHEAEAASATPVVDAPAPAPIFDPFAGTPFSEDYDPFRPSPFNDSPFSAPPSEAPREPAPLRFDEPSEDFGMASTFGVSAFDPPHEPAAFLQEPSSDEDGFIADFPAEPQAPSFSAEDFAAAQAFTDDEPLHHGFEPAARHDAFSFDQPHEPAAHATPAFDAPMDDAVAPPPSAGVDFDAAPTRGDSTRELIAAARAAARQAAQPSEKDARKERGGPLARFGKRRDSSSVRNAMLASGAVAVLGLSAAGYVLYRPDVIAGWSKGGDPAKMDATTPAATPQTSPPEPLAANLTADTTASSPNVGADTASSMAPADTTSQSDLYNQAKDKIKASDASGIDIMRKVADQGYAPAEFYMAKLYEDGDAGIKKDLTEARRWTQRAADAGDPKAMHNLGLYYFHGDGGAKNVAMAASWFRRAADLGLVDSQYNLAQLYEEGLGVSQNPAEAYKWFLIAAKSGDGESKVSANRLKAELSVSAQQAAERAASVFQAESTAAPTAQTAAAAPDAEKASLTMAQQALSKLGYYKGPADGANSPALRLAIASYQRTLGQTADGVLNPDLMAKFNVITAKSGSPG